MSLLHTATLKTLSKKNGLSAIYKDVNQFYFAKIHLTSNIISDTSNLKNQIVEKKIHLHNAINWLLHNQKQQKDGGFATYHFISGWTSSYPETSGYLIPTLIDTAKYLNREDLVSRAVLCADWLLSIQKPSGGWQSGYVADNKPEVVFNTGQIIRGMIATYLETKNEKYLDAAIKGGNWLVEIQNEMGYWDKHAYLNMIRAYDAYVSAPLAHLGQVTNGSKYSDAASKQIDWVINEMQTENVWFNNCNNTNIPNDPPITHTIAYTVDGIWDCGIILKNERYKEAAKKSALQLLTIFNNTNVIFGKYDEQWRKSANYLCVTGNAQIAIVWLKMYKYYNEKIFFDAAVKMNNILCEIQCKISDNNVYGALPGSFPIWGGYIPYGYPNWATKYFIDSLLLELSC